MKKPCVFDIEVLPNCFICCVRVLGEDKQSFEISARKFQLREMYDFFTCGKYVFIGYNCGHYDTPIMNMIFSRIEEFLYANYRDITSAAQSLSSSIVGKEVFMVYRYRAVKFFQDIDLMTMMASKALRVGLKSLQVTMCYHNVKEMVIRWSEDIHTDKIDEVIKYCFNDIGSTEELLHLLKNDVLLRKQIQKEFNISCLSKDGVGIGVDIFTKFVCEKLQCHPKQLQNYLELPDKIIVRDLIDPLVKFKTKPFQELLKWYQQMELPVDFEESETAETSDNSDSKYKKTILYGKLQHTFALGGVHSVNKPTVYTSTDEWFYIDKDVESYYPSLALAYLFGPHGFLKEFLEVMQFLKDGRVEAKKTGDKLKNETYKLALNSILGNLRNKYSPYYAPQANVGICVNGQLFLAMLIEWCELEGIECVSSNTDGATFKVHRTMLERFEQICSEWSQLTRMKLEDTIFEKMVIYAVNDYVAFKKGFKSVSYLINHLKGEPGYDYVKGYSDVRDEIEFLDPYTAIHEPKHEKLQLASQYVKEKGMFITVPRLGKGLDMLIVPKAIQNYFGKNILAKQTIEQCDNIWDFLKFQKIGKQFGVQWNQEEQQHINRFYVSKKGAYLYKTKTSERWDKAGNRFNTISLSNVLKGYGVQLFNEYEEKPMSEYNIQYSYYLKQANEIISKLEPIQQTLF